MNDYKLIFIDDCGDPGFKEDSSKNFLMVAVVFNKPSEALLVSESIADFRQSLHWNDNHEFKFNKLNKDIVITLLKLINRFNFEIYVVCTDKIKFKQTAPIIDKNTLYNWMIKKLLTKIFIEKAKIEIDGRSSKMNMRETATYLRRGISKEKKRGIRIKFVDSSKDNLIQLADLLAGSIGRFLDNEKTDSDRYIRIFQSKIKSITCV